jgi:hypothetical protein
LNEVYRNRISRRGSDGSLIFHSIYKLGALGSDLAAISWFFDPPFAEPIAGLTAEERAWVLAVASYALRAQGRLREALLAFRAGLAMHESGEDWENTARVTANMGEAELLVGEVAAARATVERAVTLADRSGDEFLMSATRADCAATLAAAGERAAAEGLFADAEARPQSPTRLSPAVFARRLSILRVAAGQKRICRRARSRGADPGMGPAAKMGARHRARYVGPRTRLPRHWARVRDRRSDQQF